MTRAQQKRNAAWTVFFFFHSGSYRLFFCCCSGQKLISRFGKERLNNIWQAQVPPRSVPPSLPTVGGKPGGARRGCAHSHRRDSLCLWYQMNVVGFVFEYTDRMQKRDLEAGHVQVYQTIACGLGGTFSVSSAVSDMHTVNPSMMWHHSNCLQHVCLYVT